MATYDDRLGASKDRAREMFEEQGIGIQCPECHECWSCEGESGAWQRDQDGNWYHWHGGIPPEGWIPIGV